MRRALLVGIAFGLGTASVSAQSGTTVWSMRMQMPDSLQARAAGMKEIDLRMTLASDGNRLGIQVDLGEGMAAAMPGMDMSSMRVHTVIHSNGDSVSVGVVLPPELAAAMGGGIGLRIDAAIPDTLGGFPLPDVDSLMNANEEKEPSLLNTGQVSTVAGVQCEEWEVIPAPTDSIPDPGKAALCLAESVPALRAFTSLMERYMPKFGSDLGELKAMGKKWFGGRDMVAIRVVLTGPTDMVLQLESATNSAPDASFFVLPEGLQPFPMEMIQAFTAGMQQGAARAQP